MTCPTCRDLGFTVFRGEARPCNCLAGLLWRRAAVNAAVWRVFTRDNPAYPREGR